MNIEQGESLHRFVIFSTEDGRRLKVVSKQTKEGRIAAELVIEDMEHEPAAHKFLNSAANSETFDRGRFDEILNSLMQIENSQLKKLCQKKFLGLWNFSEVEEMPRDALGGEIKY